MYLLDNLGALKRDSQNGSLLCRIIQISLVSLISKIPQSKTIMETFIFLLLKWGNNQRHLMVLKLTFYLIFYADNTNLGSMPFSNCHKRFMTDSMGVAQTSRFMLYLLSGHNYAQGVIFSHTWVYHIFVLCIK